eukprot:12910020-Prorocentrum_lima.AAC.1
MVRRPESVEWYDSAATVWCKVVPLTPTSKLHNVSWAHRISKDGKGHEDFEGEGQKAKGRAATATRAARALGGRRVVG